MGCASLARPGACFACLCCILFFFFCPCVVLERAGRVPRRWAPPLAVPCRGCRMPASLAAMGGGAVPFGRATRGDGERTALSTRRLHACVGRSPSNAIREKGARKERKKTVATRCFDVLVCSSRIDGDPRHTRAKSRRRDKNIHPIPLPLRCRGGGVCRPASQTSGKRLALPCLIIFGGDCRGRRRASRRLRV